MVKRFKTAEGKRMTVRMTDDEVLSRMVFNASLFVCGLFLAVLLWGTI